MELGEWVKTMRKRQGLTQGQLARLCGLTQGTISAIESGELKRVRIDTLVSLRLKLGYPAEFLRSREEILQDEEPDPDADERLILRRYRNLSPEGKAKVKSYLAHVEREERSGARD